MLRKLIFILFIVILNSCVKKEVINIIHPPENSPIEDKNLTEMVEKTDSNSLNRNNEKLINSMEMFVNRRGENVYSWEVEDRAYPLPVNHFYSILDDSINVRLSPNLEGKIIDKLPLHEEVFIEENTFIEQKIDNTSAYWYKIRTYDNSINGYIWGGYIASLRKRFLYKEFENSPINGELFLYVRYTKYFLGDIGYGFDIRNDLYIYIENKRIKLPVDYEDKKHKNSYYVFDDIDIFLISGELYLYIYGWNPIGNSFYRFLVNDDRIVFIQDTETPYKMK